MTVSLYLDTFRADLFDEDGNVTVADVLFARATGRAEHATYSYHAPVFEEDDGAVLAHAHELLAAKVIHGLLTHTEVAA